MKYGTYSPNTHSQSFAVLLTILMIILVDSYFSLGHAAKNKVFKDDDGTFELAKCRSMVDTEKNPRDQSENDHIANSCCSKEYGYCIECPKATPNTCTRYPYRIFSKRLTLPKDDVLAPTIDETVPKRPGKAPQLQLDAPQVK